MVLSELEKSAINNPHSTEKGPAIITAEKGYEDIHSDTPYIDFDYDGNKAIVHLFYMPPHLRGNGLGIGMFHNWLNQLDNVITHIVLKSCKLSTGHTKPFWESFGFKPAYCGCINTVDGDASDILTLGANHHQTPAPIELKEGQSAHYIFGVIEG